ncbi:MAG TPA: TolC family protein [Candidatus Udaeobacter sp.]|jgi:outer membrane protein TolC|nr:TolC family protein [Candidatus Udaeobacter sp.]
MKPAFARLSSLLIAFLISVAAALPAGAAAGSTPSLRLTLPEAIAMARGQSPSALVAAHRYRTSYWEYVTFKADTRPTLNLDLNPVDWQRTIAEQTLSDGTDAFVPRSQANSSAGISLNKVMSWSGGQISLRSDIARTQAFEGDAGFSFYAAPIQVSLYQPLFTFNPYSWAQKIEPGRLTEARQQYVEDLESVSSDAISYFFDLLSAETSLRDATTEKAQADTVLAVTRRRFRMNPSLDIDVLQAELANVNADLRLTRARVDVTAKEQRLISFLGFDQLPQFELVPPSDVPDVSVDLNTAISEARQNRPTAMSFGRQLLEADRNVAQARSTRGNTALTASFGLSRTTSDLPSLYHDPSVDQRARIGITTPILDWGRSQARIAVSESQREVTRREIQRQRADFERDVFLRVSQFEIQAGQVRQASLADSIAQRRFEMTRQRYLAGQGDLNSLNIAQAEKEGARGRYLDAMRAYWAGYYDVRRATLYDFERDQALTAPPVSF